MIKILKRQIDAKENTKTTNKRYRKTVRETIKNIIEVNDCINNTSPRKYLFFALYIDRYLVE